MDPSDEVVGAAPASRRAGLRASVWAVVPQVVTRLVSFYVFAAVGHRVDSARLGALTLGVAIGVIAVPLAPALVAKPMAGAGTDADRALFGRLSCAMALWLAVAVAVVLAPVAALGHGLTRVAVLAGMIALPSTMVVETAFWRRLLLGRRRQAAVRFSAAYVVQAVLVSAAALLLHGDALVLVTAATLVPPAVVEVLQAADLGPRTALVWARGHRHRWVAYLTGTAASLVASLATPVVLSAAAGYGAAAAFRAAELGFGGTNLLIGIAVQQLLARSGGGERRLFRTVSSGLVVVAALNGLVLALLPGRLLHVLFGTAASSLRDVLPEFTVQRAALAVSSAGIILLLTHLPPRRAGALDVASAALSVVALVPGALLGGLTGALLGLAAAEVLWAVVSAWLLRTAR